MKVNISELSGRALDWAVAKAVGATSLRFDTVASWWFTLYGEDRVLSTGWSDKQNYAPSFLWSQAGPIIERERIHLLCHYSVVYGDGARWRAAMGGDVDYPWSCELGPTPLIAAMRCYVASKLGEEVDVPEELL